MPLVWPLIPEPSMERYNQVYERLVGWCRARNIEDETTEKVLLNYFEYISKFCKPPSLWAYYSMLRGVISVKKNVDITKYSILSAFLKNKNRGYRSRPEAKSKILSKQDVEKFLLEAEDEKFLLMKVVLIIGLSGACYRQELASLRWEHVTDEGDVLHVVLVNEKSDASREFYVTYGVIDGVDVLQIVRKYMNLRPKNTDHGRFFVAFRNGACTKQPVGKSTIGRMPKMIATFLNLPTPEEYKGHCFRSSAKAFTAYSDIVVYIKS